MKKKFITEREYKRRSRQAVLKKDYVKTLDLSVARFENLLQEDQWGPSGQWSCNFCSIFRKSREVFQMSSGCRHRGSCPVDRICAKWTNSFKDKTAMESVLRVLKSKRMRDRCKQYTKKLRTGKS